MFVGFLQNEWVICRVFQKGAGGKKINISSLSRLPDPEASLSVLPPLTDASPSNNTAAAAQEAFHCHVTCFSDPTHNPQGRQLQVDTTDGSSNSIGAADLLLPSNSSSDSYLTSPSKDYARNQDSAVFPDPWCLERLLLENYGPTSLGAMDLDFLWKY